MVEVSDNFKALAQSNGRHVYCRIEAGSEVFLDDRIIEFDFDDVAHPDWFTLGTTCANRFYFKVKYNGELEVKEAVKPYISFDNEEWCALGIFYISRRYVRGNYASIVCYDKMYSLDMEYVSALTLPTDTVSILSEVCEQAGLECEDTIISLAVGQIPVCTVRDMIGYLAGINRSCAKLDRSEKLVFKKVGVGDSYIDEKNCMSIQRNMGRSVITCVKADTGNEVLVSGEGAEISTLEMYNPIMSQNRLDSIKSLFAPFSFYGADVEMQGLPYLEAGERVYLLEKGLLYPLVASEIEYHYDGGLTAWLYSKNKTYSDAAEKMDDLEQLLKELKTSIGTMYSKHTNDKMLAIKDEQLIVADFEFDTVISTFAQIDMNFTIDESTADVLIISVYVNGVKIDRDATHYMVDGGKVLLHYYYLAENLPAGGNRIYITMRTKNGDAYILPSQLIATILAYGLKGNGGGDIRDKLSLLDEIPTISYSYYNRGISEVSVKSDVSAENAAEDTSTDTGTE